METAPYRVEEYIREDGSMPYRKWFDALDSAAAVKASTAVARLRLGNTSNVKWFSGIGEYRIDWGPGYRVYLATEADALIILYGGGTKDTQSKDIERALALHAEYQARKIAEAAGPRSRGAQPPKM